MSFSVTSQGEEGMTLLRDGPASQRLSGNGFLFSGMVVSERISRKSNEEKTIYTMVYSEFSKDGTTGSILLKTKVRPAGLEPATPCLEGRSELIIKTA